IARSSLPEGSSRAPDARSRASRELELTVRRAAPFYGLDATVIAPPARDRVTSRPRPGQLDAQCLRQSLEGRLGIWKAGESMSTEIAESEAGRCRGPDRCSGR